MTGTGTVDLAAKTLAFRVEPKLVMSIEGQGSAANPVGLGIPVVIEGPWAEPRIYPEMAGMLDNPDAAYAKLKEMGKGLFGPGGIGGQPGQGSGLSDQLGGKKTSQARCCSRDWAAAALLRRSLHRPRRRISSGRPRRTRSRRWTAS